MNPEIIKPEVVTEPDTYEAPKVETVLSADDLAREIQYAGITVLPG